MSTAWDNVARVDSVRLGNSTIFRGTYKWVISSFASKKNADIESSTFSIKGFGSDEFYFLMTRHVQDNPSQEVMFKISLKRTALQWTLCNCAIQFDLIKKIDQENDEECRITDPFSESTTLAINFKSEKSLQWCQEYYKLGDTVTILCKFQLTKTSEEISSTHTSMSQDMKRVLDDQTYTDVTLQIGDKCLKAHKVILTARSPVFAAMFESEMKESKDNKVEITDISEDVLQAFLTYIYTDEIPNRDTMTIDLLGVANKYDVKSLKRKCEEYLIDNVTVENAAEILIQADLHNSEELKKKIIQFINFSKSDFVKTDGYKELRKSHVELIVELFEELHLK